MAISYVESSDMQNNIEAVIKIMQHMYNTILYAEMNFKLDQCNECGYDGEIQKVEKDGKLISVDGAVREEMPFSDNDIEWRKDFGKRIDNGNS